MQKNYKILLVEDDPNIGSLLRSYLETQFFQVRLASDGDEGFLVFQEDREIDICVLDVNLPKRDGFQLAEDIRQLNLNIPIIFLTVRDGKEDVLKGYDQGADEYISKPFESEILVKKINSVLSRAYNSQIINQDVFEIGAFKFDTKLRRLGYKDEAPKNISLKESYLLQLLAENMNSITLRSQIMRDVWKHSSEKKSRVMDVYIAKLRKFLSRDERIKIINIHGKGFELVVRIEPNVVK